MARMLQLPASELGYHPKFSPKKFRAVIQVHGRDVLLEREVACGCRKVTTVLGNEDGLFNVDSTAGGEIGGEPAPDCPDCGGTGSKYTVVQATRALVMQDRRKGFRNSRDGASSDQGTVLITLLPEAVPAYLDRVVVLDASEKIWQHVIRKGTIDKLLYPIITREIIAGSGADPTVAETLQESVIHLQLTGDDGKPLGVPRVCGKDFDVTPAGHIDWTRGIILGTAPEIGANYAVTAWAHPRYVIQESPNENRAQTTHFPNQSGMRKDAASTAMPIRVRAVLEITGPPPGASA